MTREWAPGDVALVPFAEGDVRAMWIAGQGWAVADGTRGVSKSYIGVRPLLVLDPESDDDAHRLIRAFWDHHNDDCDDEQAMRDAMRSLVAPPEPPKPEVYEHFVERAVDDLSRALCGKVWAPKGDAVTVIGKCPACAHLKRSTGWSA
jgi:hypothetical protein